LAQGGYDMIAHHIAATLSIWLAITSHQGHFYTLAMLATEVTTPFVNLRWHLDVAVSSGFCRPLLSL
jgi:TLC domain